MRAAAIQVRPGPDRQRNLEKAGEFIERAADAGARLAVLPEKFNVMGPSDVLIAAAEPLDGPTISWAAEIAGRRDLWIVAGSIVESAADGRRFNTSVLVSPAGEIAAAYRKLHMFDVTVGGVEYEESDATEPGSEVVTADIDGVRAGLAVCYDLRFPELFRALALRGAEFVTLPAQFTVATGRDHWEPLLRARAIENQLFVIASGGFGEWAPGRPSYGRSLVADPWGVVLAQCADGEGFVIADLDFDGQRRMRSELPCLAHRRDDVYGPAAGSA